MASDPEPRAAGTDALQMPPDGIRVGVEQSSSKRSLCAADSTSQANDLEVEAPPPWSELKTKAGKERKRLPLACMACRRKKIRCSGEKPACKHCLRSRIPCVYKFTTHKAAPRTDYMAMLDRRLKRMEDRIIKLMPKDEQGLTAETGRAVVKPAASPQKTPAGRKRGASQAFCDELDEWAKAGVPARALLTRPATGPGLLNDGADQLPPLKLQEHLAEVFFNHVYGQSYYLLHKPTFMCRLAQGSLPPVLVLAVCAISARFSHHPALQTEPSFLRGEQWASVAREISLRRYDTPNITIIIVYLILALHELGTCHGGRSWMFGGMAQRMAYALQLHRDLDHEPITGRNDLSVTELEIQRRVMWSCFLMDRFSSSGTDRPLFISNQYIRAPLPIREDYFRMEVSGRTENLEGTKDEEGNTSNLGVAAYTIRLVAIWGELTRYFNLGGREKDAYATWEEKSIFQSIRRSADAWLESLPLSLHNTPENLQIYSSQQMANQFVFMHIVHNHILLFMNRFAVPFPKTRLGLAKDVPAEFVQSSYRATTEAANRVSALIRDAANNFVTAPFAGYCAFLSSTVHIHNMFSNNASLEASSQQNLVWNIQYLGKMKRYWGMFHFVTDILRDMYRRCADAARESRPTQDGQSVYQYGDWFNHYPHGVSGVDYEEPCPGRPEDVHAEGSLTQNTGLQTVEEYFSKLQPHQRLYRRRQSKAPQAAQAQQSSNTLPPFPLQHQPFSQASPSNFPNINPLLAHSPTHMLPDLTRLNSFDNGENDGMNDFAFQPPLDLFNSDTAFPQHQGPPITNMGTGLNGSGFWNDLSSGWLAPFNLNSPAAVFGDLVDENNNNDLAGLDWSSVLNTAQQDLSGLTTTTTGLGLTPGLPTTPGLAPGLSVQHPLSIKSEPSAEDENTILGLGLDLMDASNT